MGIEQGEPLGGAAGNASNRKRETNWNGLTPDELVRLEVEICPTMQRHEWHKQAVVKSPVSVCGRMLAQTLTCLKSLNGKRLLAEQRNIPDLYDLGVVLCPQSPDTKKTSISRLLNGNDTRKPDKFEVWNECRSLLRGMLLGIPAPKIDSGDERQRRAARIETYFFGSKRDTLPPHFPPEQFGSNAPIRSAEVKYQTLWLAHQRATNGGTAIVCIASGGSPLTLVDASGALSETGEAALLALLVGVDFYFVVPRSKPSLPVHDSLKSFRKAIGAVIGNETHLEYMPAFADQLTLLPKAERAKAVTRIHEKLLSPTDSAKVSIQQVRSAFPKLDVSRIAGNDLHAGLFLSSAIRYGFASYSRDGDAPHQRLFLARSPSASPFLVEATAEQLTEFMVWLATFVL